MAIVVEKGKEERLKLSLRSLIAHGNNKQHHCQYCIIQGMKKKTKWKCYDYDLYLCQNGKNDNCFFNYHKKYVVLDLETNEQ